MTASEDVRLLREGDLRSSVEVVDLRVVVGEIGRVKNRGIGEKKQEEESTRRREEMLLVAAIFNPLNIPNDKTTFHQTIFFFNYCFRFFLFDIILVLLLC